jgi:hypothetical protein
MAKGSAERSGDLMLREQEVDRMSEASSKKREKSILV